NHYREVDVRYAHQVVQVTADTAALASLSGQVLFLTTCNLLARWCRRAAITVEDVAPHQRLRGDGSLVSRAVSTMRDADPFGEFSTELPDRANLHVHIGENPPEM